MQVFTPDEAINATKRMLQAKGFEITARSSKSLYMIKYGCWKKIRISNHQKDNKFFLYDIAYNIVYDNNTIINDIEFRVATAIRLYK